MDGQKLSKQQLLQTPAIKGENDIKQRNLLFKKSKDEDDIKQRRSQKENSNM